MNKNIFSLIIFSIFSCFVTFHCIRDLNQDNAFNQSQRDSYTNNFLNDAHEKSVQSSWNKTVKNHKILSSILVKQKKFKKLILLFHDLHDGFKDDINTENLIHNELSAISNTRENLEVYLNDFVKEYPHIYIPYLYRGVYYTGKSWQSRGTKSYKDTNNTNILWMRHFHELARKDLNKALEINNNLLYPYIFHLQIDRASNSSSHFYKHIDQALELEPESYYLWFQILSNLQSKWGGSLSYMEEAIRSAKTYIETNNKMSELDFFLMREKADQKDSQGDLEASINLYKAAIDKGDNYSRYPLSIALWNNKKYIEACKHIKKSLEFYPTDWYLHDFAIYCKYNNISVD